MLQEIIKQAEKEFSEPVDNNPSYAPTQKDIIDLIDLYWVDKFQNNEYNALGVKKFFYNVIEAPSLVASKMIDLDTKDILVKAEDGQSYYPAWIFGKELHLWMKNTKNVDDETFGQLLNKISYNLPKYGHIVLKKVKDTVSLVPLSNIICNQTAKNFLSSDVFIEIHDYTPEEFKAVGTKNKWDNVKDIYEIFKDTDKITVYEVCSYELEDGKNYHICINGATGSNKEFQLFASNIDRKELYKEFKWDEIPGRAMGRGVVEKLFEPQIQMNTVANYKADGLAWTSKHMFQTKDDGVGRNLMTEADNGEVLTVNSEITVIPMEERNLSAYIEEENRLDALVNNRTFSYDEVRGERAPAGTPLGSSVLQVQMAGGYYDLKREDLGMFVKGIIVDWILPTFKKNVSVEHDLLLGEFSEAELTQLRNSLIVHYTNSAIINFIIKEGRLPDMQESAMLKSITTDGIKSLKTLKIPSDYYDNMKYKIQVIVTGESIDVGTKMQTLQQLLQIVGGNPEILQNPASKQFLDKLMDMAGISPVGLDSLMNATADVNSMMAGMTSEAGMMSAQGATPPMKSSGSISKPLPQSKSPIQTQSQL